MNFIKIYIVVIAFCLVTAPSKALESKQKKIGQFKNWIVMKGIERGNDFCYAYSLASASLGGNGLISRNSYFLAVWHGKNQFSVSTHLGFSISNKTPVYVDINDYQILLQNAAPFNGTTYSAIQDKQALNELVENAHSFKVKSWDTYGQVNTDYYNSNGFVKSLNMMQKKCQ